MKIKLKFKPYKERVLWVRKPIEQVVKSKKIYSRKNKVKEDES